jgi:hypothetical protein
LCPKRFSTIEGLNLSRPRRLNQAPMNRLKKIRIQKAIPKMKRKKSTPIVSIA